METASQECVKASEETGSQDDVIKELEDDEGFDDFDDQEVFVQGVMQLQCQAYSMHFPL